MATSIKIKIRRGSTSEWTTANPILALGEIGADMDKHRLKVGNGVSRWNELEFCPVIVNDLTTGGIDKALSAEMGKNIKNELNNKANVSDIVSLQEQIDTIISGGGVTVYDDLDSYQDDWALSANMGRKLNEDKADKSELEELQDMVRDLLISGGVEVLDDLTSASKTSALSANKGRELNEKLKGIGIFGMGYEITARNAYSRPTKIKFDDGVTCTLNWLGGTVLQTIIASTGETMTINYNEDGAVSGRTITR